MKEIPVITIDGPSGSGKGTISSIVAAKLGWHMLDSGALYRLVALGAGKHAIAFDDEPGLADYARCLDVQFEVQPGKTEVLTRLEGENVGDSIRTETVGNNASKVAALPAVREALLSRQRDFLCAPGLVADGRDMGTVVFPDASLKIYLTASVEERAKRRHKQLKEKGISAILKGLVQEISGRDARDMNRPIAPLKPADDAIILDTSKMPVEVVVEKVLQYVAATRS